MYSRSRPAIAPFCWSGEKPRCGRTTTGCTTSWTRRQVRAAGGAGCCAALTPVGAALGAPVTTGRAVCFAGSAGTRSSRPVCRSHAADERRWPSRETDYGGNWYEHIPPELWRVAYVRDTGEVYADRTQEGELVRVLGVVPADGLEDSNRGLWYRTLDEVLEGWPERCNKPWGLIWLKERLGLAAVNGVR